MCNYPKKCASHLVRIVGDVKRSRSDEAEQI